MAKPSLKTNSHVRLLINTGVLECPNLQSRSGNSLALKCLDTACMLPIRAAKAGAIQSRILPGPSRQATQENRPIVFTDRRLPPTTEGAIPSVNVRDIENSQVVIFRVLS